MVDCPKLPYKKRKPNGFVPCLASAIDEQLARRLHEELNGTFVKIISTRRSKRATEDVSYQGEKNTVAGHTSGAADVVSSRSGRDQEEEALKAKGHVDKAGGKHKNGEERQLDDDPSCNVGDLKRRAEALPEKRRDEAEGPEQKLVMDPEEEGHVKDVPSVCSPSDCGGEGENRVKASVQAGKNHDSTSKKKDFLPRELQGLLTDMAIRDGSYHQQRRNRRKAHATTSVDSGGSPRLCCSREGAVSSADGTAFIKTTLKDVKVETMHEGITSDEAAKVKEERIMEVEDSVTDHVLGPDERIQGPGSLPLPPSVVGGKSQACGPSAPADKHRTEDVAKEECHHGTVENIADSGSKEVKAATNAGSSSPGPRNPRVDSKVDWTKSSSVSTSSHGSGLVGDMGDQEGDDMQEGEENDLPEYSHNAGQAPPSSVPRPLKVPRLPMVKYKEGWYRARVLEQKATEVLLELSGLEAETGSFWLPRDSDRIWRGSYRGRDWRHLGDGAWEPKPRKNGQKVHKPQRGDVKPGKSSASDGSDGRLEPPGRPGICSFTDNSAKAGAAAPSKEKFKDVGKEQMMECEGLAHNGTGCMLEEQGHEGTSSVVSPKGASRGGQWPSDDIRVKARDPASNRTHVASQALRQKRGLEEGGGPNHHEASGASPLRAHRRKGLPQRAVVDSEIGAQEATPDCPPSPEVAALIPPATACVGSPSPPEQVGVSRLGWKGAWKGAWKKALAHKEQLLSTTIEEAPSSAVQHIVEPVAELPVNPCPAPVAMVVDSSVTHISAVMEQERGGRAREENLARSLSVMSSHVTGGSCSTRTPGKGITTQARGPAAETAFLLPDHKQHESGDLATVRTASAVKTSGARKRMAGLSCSLSVKGTPSRKEPRLGPRTPVTPKNGNWLSPFLPRSLFAPSGSSPCLSSLGPSTLLESLPSIETVQKLAATHAARTRPAFGSVVFGAPPVPLFK